MCWSIRGRVSVQICQDHRSQFCSSCRCFPHNHLTSPAQTGEQQLQCQGWVCSSFTSHPSSQGCASPAAYMHFSCWGFESTNGLSWCREEENFPWALYCPPWAVSLRNSSCSCLADMVWLLMLTVALELPPLPITTSTQLGNRQFIYPPGKSLVVLLLSIRSAVRYICTMEFRVRFQSSVIKVVNNKLEFHSSLFS